MIATIIRANISVVAKTMTLTKKRIKVRSLKHGLNKRALGRRSAFYESNWSVKIWDQIQIKPATGK